MGNLLFACVIFIVSFLVTVAVAVAGEQRKFPVGVVLDMDTWVGNISRSCISMATDDFYAYHSNYTTRLDFYIRNSKEDVVSAASAGTVTCF